MTTVNRTFFRIAAATAVLLSALTLTAAPKRRARGLGKELSLNSAGLRIRVPAGVRRQMLAPLEVRATRRSDGTAMYAAKDLWKYIQAVAVWSGGGAAVELVRVKYPPPDGRDVFISIAGAEKFWSPYSECPDDREILRWCKFLFGVEAERLVDIDRKGDFSWRRLEPAGRDSAIFFGSGMNSGELHMFMIRISWRRAGDGDDRDWRRLAERCVWSAKMIPVRKPEDSGDGVYAERLAQARKSIAGVRNWYIRETPNYIFVTNQRSRADMRHLQNDLELARALFGAYFPLPPGRSCVGVVKLFADRKEYLRYVGKNMSWTAGVWRPLERELVVSPLGGQANDRIVERYMRKVALHEGFHQYIFYVANEVNPALWFNEGCAQFFENFSPRDGAIAAPDAREAAKLAGAVAGCRDLEEFVHLDHAGFYAANGRARNYALSYALCYYLLRGAPALGETKFAAVPESYIEELRRTRDLGKARDRAFAGIDFKELHAKLKAFWNDPEQQRRAKEYRDPRLN